MDKGMIDVIVYADNILNLALNIRKEYKIIWDIKIGWERAEIIKISYKNRMVIEPVKHIGDLNNLMVAGISQG